MKFHQYALRQMRSRGISEEWCGRVVENSVATETQADGRTRHWGYISETDQYIRVVLLEDGETVINAFPDRRFKERIERDES